MNGRAAVIVFITASALWAQEIHLKSRTLRGDPTGTPQRSAVAAHRIVQFDHSPGVEDLDALLKDGAKVVSVLPDNALVVSTPNNRLAMRAGVRWVGRLDAADKLSPEFARRNSPGSIISAIVEFHPDVTEEAQNAIAAAEGVGLLRPPTLLAQHAAAEVDMDRLRKLAEHDEVAYLFPADPALLTDAGFNACAGMLTIAGPVAQYANLIHGWDLDSDGAAHLGYVFASLTTRVPAATVQSEIIRALNEWAKHTNLIFESRTLAGAARTILIRFASGAHGDAYSFDGPGGILAHTFYPVPVNPEAIAGDMHLDADENWHAGSDLDIYSVALHEAGHAIGLGHSDKPGDVMYPYYRHGMALSPSDIGAAQALYGVPGATSIAPLQPNPPGNSTAPSTPVLVPLSLTLDPAPVSTRNPQITLTGILSGGSEPFTIQWQTDHGYTGRATLTSAGSWAATGITLANGPNLITISAFDGAHRTATAVASVSLAAPTPPSGEGAPISISISTPASAITTWNSATVSIAGTASGGSGIVRITWQTSTGSAGTATGTGHWLATAVPVLKGTNTVVVRAYDAAGASAWAAIVVVKN
ncbi:MAG TPA: matrixin family metalloprotease [Bryobacteraceae bacterium]|nr:matrixin family metalloprotease [Bryobacteraceae bacterium]